MLYKDNVYVSKVAGLLAEYYSFLGYPDAWVLGVAETAIRNGAWSLAREALNVFCYGRTFYGMEAAGLNYLEKLILGEPIDTYSGEYVELTELQEEELPL